LHTDLTSRGRFPLDEVVSLGLSLVSALGHLHQHGLLHRDIKPANVIFVRNVPKLADIGLVTKIDEVGTLVGTPGYMAPEGSVGPDGDLYSLGKVLYEISSGKNRHQFPELPTDILEGSDAPRFLRLNRILIRACANDSQKRYRTAEEMHADLTALSSRRIASGTSYTTEGEIRTSTTTSRTVITILGSTVATEASALSKALQTELTRHDLDVLTEPAADSGVPGIQEMEQQIRRASAIVVMLSPGTIQSEMFAYQLELARDAARQQDGRPRLLPVRIRWEEALSPDLAAVLEANGVFSWQSPNDTPRLIDALLQAIRFRQPFGTVPGRPLLESPGGAVPLDSQYYVIRRTDQEFEKAIERRDSIVLVKGARQMGKTSLLARGLQRARQCGARIVLTDFQKLDASHLASANALFRQLADFLADQLDLEVLPDQAWDERRSPNTNFERYLRREVLGKLPGHFVWGLDEVDRLFACSFGGEVFGLLRSWHNERALDPTGPWARLTLAIAYATEAHLFITDVNQSPFNVGTRLSLDDFDPDQVADLNRRYGSPIGSEINLRRLATLLGGHPYLVRHALNELASGRTTFVDFVQQADRDEGIFGDHLRRILVLLSKDPALCQVVRGILQGQPSRDITSFYRLRSAGVMKGATPEQAAPRCEVYAKYLQRQLL
jgi:hypothetical protein